MRNYLANLTKEASIPSDLNRQPSGALLDHSFQRDSLEGRVQKAASSFRNLPLTKAWGRWLEFSTSCAEARLIMSHAVINLLKGRLRMCVNTWASHVNAWRYANALVHQTFVAMNLREVRAGFSTWKDLLCQRASNRRVIKRAMLWRRAMDRGAVRATMGIWSEHTNQQLTQLARKTLDMREVRLSQHRQTH